MQLVTDAPASALNARAVLENRIENAKVSVQPLIERVMAEVPEDAVVRTPALKFGYASPEVPVLHYPGVDRSSEFGRREVSVDLTLHNNAVQQLRDKVHIGRKFYEYLDNPEVEEKQQFLARTMNGLFALHDEQRLLVRSYKGQAKAVLSNTYKPMISGELMDRFMGLCQSLGAVPVEGHVTDLRVAMKVVLPKVYEPVAGEPMVFGLEWHDSQYGRSSHSIRVFAERLVCANGMVGEDVLRNIHLGAKMDEGFEFSRETYQLNTKAIQSAMGDVVNQALGEKAIQRRCDIVTEAHSKEMNWRSGFAKVSKELTKAEGTTLQTVFEGPDVVMLPPGQTNWRFSNALSWLANQSDDGDRKLELQRLAGKVLPKAA